MLRLQRLGQVVTKMLLDSFALSEHAPKMNLHEAVYAYISERQSNRSLRANSVHTIKYQLLGFRDAVGAERDPNSIRLADVSAWINECGARGDAAKTLRGKASAVRCFYEWLTVRGLADHDPTFGLQRAKLDVTVPRAFEREHVARIFEACENTRERLIVSLMVQEGFRAYEVANLLLDDVDRGRDLIKAHGKGGKDRTVPLSAGTRRALAEYLDAHPAPVFGAVVRSFHDELTAVSPATVSRCMSTVMYRAGLKQHAHDGVSGHALRHTAVTDVLDASGGKVQVAQQFAGHASLDSTMIYMQARGIDEIRAAVAGRDYEAEPAAS